ncbi:MAG: hypothetical protein Kow00124_32040 [Anaerolineae bacterium]
MGVEPQQTHAPRGMRTFIIILIGQLISVIGSGVTSFALGVWIYDTTGRATPFALTALFATLPAVLLAPVAGALVDRWDRRRVMIAADTGAALATLFAAVMAFTGRLEVWHIYLIALVSSSCGAFQEPAFSASITLLVPKEQYGRAAGMRQGIEAIQTLIAPLLAGVLYVSIGLRGVMLIDFATFFVAVGTLLVVRIPRPSLSEESRREGGDLLREMGYGWRYITARPGLLAMLIYFAFTNFALNLSGALLVPLVLSFSGAAVLGVIQSLSGLSMLAGSLVMGIWGGPRRRMRGIYILIALAGLAFMLVGLRPSPWLTGAGIMLLMLIVPISSGSSQAIWQSKVAPDVQGRVFATRRMIGYSMMPLAFLLAGPLADGIFEPLMAPDGALAPLLGPLIGVGQGRGIGLMFALCGVLLLLLTALAAAYTPLRRVETDLPDALPDAPVSGAAGEAAPAEP